MTGLDFTLTICHFMGLRLSGGKEPEMNGGSIQDNIVLFLKVFYNLKILVLC